MGTTIRLLHWLWLTLCVTCLAVSAQSAQPPSTPLFKFDIPAGTLTDALRAIGQQTGLQVSVWAEASPESISSPRISGTYTLDAVLRHLLAPAGLTYRMVNERSFVVEALATTITGGSSVYEFNWPRQSVADAILALSYQTNIQVANDSSKACVRTLVPPVVGRFTALQAADLIAGSQAAKDLAWMPTVGDAIRFYCVPSAAKQQVRNEPPENLAGELLVVGSRMSPNASAQLATISSIAQFDQKDIQALNFESAAGFLNYTPQQPYARTEPGAGGNAYAELRGFGMDTTLVLIDGQRTYPTVVTENSFDLNNVSAALLDRIEVLPDSASAVYGGEAMGGVINLIFKRRFQQPRAELEYAGRDGGGRTRRASLGLTHDTERSSTTLFLESFDRDILLGKARRLWRDQDYRRFGGADYRSPAANPGTIYSLTGSNLNGLSSATAAVPDVMTDAEVSTEDFLQTQGQHNVSSLSRYYTVVPSQQRQTGLLRSQVTLNDNTSLSAQLLLVDSQKEFQSEPLSLLGARVPADNPYNPFGEDVLVDYLLTGTGPELRAQNTGWARASLELEHRFADWTWTTLAVGSDEQTDTRATKADAVRAMAALAERDPSRALNVFQPGPGGSAELLNSLLDVYVDRQRSRGHQFSTQLEGMLPQVLNRSIHTRLGAEWRSESVFLHNTSRNIIQQVDRGRHVGSVFAELGIPVLIDRVSLSLSGRLDDYSDLAPVFNPRLDLAARLTPGLLSRVSYGQSARPASLFERYTPRMTIDNVPIPDPYRNNELTTVQFVTGGNPNLEPATSQSFTASILWQPPESDLQLLLTYWDTHLKDRIAVASLYQLLGEEALFSDRIERAPATPSDIAAGYRGRLLSIDGTRLNGGTIHASGIDVQSKYVRNTSHGRISTGVNATWTRRYTYRSLPGVPTAEAVGRSRIGLGSIPRWNVVGRTSWEVPGFTFNGVLRWIPHYDDVDLFGTPTGHRIGSRTSIDAQAAFDLGALGESNFSEGMTLLIGATNVLNEMPEPSPGASLIGFDFSQFDLSGRLWYFKLIKEF